MILLVGFALFCSYYGFKAGYEHAISEGNPHPIIQGIEYAILAPIILAAIMYMLISAGG
jgi:hypothetical protein